MEWCLVIYHIGKFQEGEVYSQSLSVGALLPGEYLLHTVLGEKTEVKAINVE